jgi:hypothetical protein
MISPCKYAVFNSLRPEFAIRNGTTRGSTAAKLTIIVTLTCQ